MIAKNNSDNTGEEHAYDAERIRRLRDVSAF